MERVLCILILSFEIVISQYAQSPCPEVFDYSSDGSNIFGVIRLRPSGPVSALHLRTNFTVGVQLSTSYAGKIEAVDGNHLLQKYNAGLTATYRVYFPITSPLPRVTEITVNGQTICYAPPEYPRPGQYVTSLSLQHSSFIRGGAVIPIDTQPFNTIPQKKPDPVLEVFTFNNIENQSWNTNADYTPYYIENKTRPVYNQPPTPGYERPTRPHKYPSFDQTPTRPFYEQPQTRPQDITQPTYDEQTPKPTHPASQVYDRVTSGNLYEKPVTKPSKIPSQSILDTIFYQLMTEPQKSTVAPAVNRDETQPSRNVECGMLDERLPLIYNGESYERGEVPWLVAIFKGKRGSISFICGGTLVSDRHIVTAAHCMHRRSELTSVQDFVVKVGVHELDDWSNDITVTRSVIAASIHKSYNATTLENDILVFTLDKRVTFNTYIRPACLWNGNTDLSRVVGASGLVAGWGDQGTSEVIGQGAPHMVTIPIVSQAQCRASKTHFHFITSSNTLCAGDRKGAGPCRGDSGGGLYLLDGGKWRLRGVVSVSLRQPNGDNTCNLMEYIVFTDTAQYLPWIRSVIDKNYYD